MLSKNIRLLTEVMNRLDQMYNKVVECQLLDADFIHDMLRIRNKAMLDLTSLIDDEVWNSEDKTEKESD